MSVSKLWVYISINVRSFIMVAFQLILIIQVVSVLQVKFLYKYRYNMISSAIWNK